MALELAIKLTNGGDLAIPLEPGIPLYVVGANGSGKSALIQHAVIQLGPNNIRRMSAHRQTWLPGAAIDITAQQRRRFDQNHEGQEGNPQSRWREYDSQTRLASVLFDLNGKQVELALRIMEHAFAKDMHTIDWLTESERPVFERINDLLRNAGLSVSIQNSSGEEIVAHHNESSTSYSMAQMSDGERNAVLLAAEILTVDPGTVLLLDEPERHLHRSIIQPLLSALFAERKDCPFVVSTHEVNLPLANPEAQVLMLRSCEWNGNTAVTWDAKLLEENPELPEDLKRDILGSRRRILFVEGKSEGLDFQLYSSLFLGISVLPVESCDKVIDAVTGLRDSMNLHDVQAFGLVDGDNRSDDNKADLEGKGIYALESCSVESIFYCLDAIKAVSEWQAISLLENANEMFEESISGALQALTTEGLAETLSARRCERRVREQVRLPTWKNILEKDSYSVEIDTRSWHEEELNLFSKLLAANDLEKITARYPIRESGVIEEIIKPLQLSRKNYRKTLLSRIGKDPELADKLRKRVGPLSGVIGAHA